MTNLENNTHDFPAPDKDGWIDVGLLSFRLKTAFAWLPVDTVDDGWIWLRFYWKYERFDSFFYEGSIAYASIINKHIFELDIKPRHL